MPTVIVQTVALLVLLFVGAGIACSLLLHARRGATEETGMPKLRRIRTLLFQAAAAGFALTLVLILVDLLIRSAREG